MIIAQYYILENACIIEAPPLIADAIMFGTRSRAKTHLILAKVPRILKV